MHVLAEPAIAGKSPFKHRPAAPACEHLGPGRDRLAGSVGRFDGVALKFARSFRVQRHFHRQVKHAAVTALACVKTVIAVFDQCFVVALRMAQAEA